MKDIEATKEMIFNQLRRKASFNKFDGFNKVYYQTNECIEGYLNKFQFSNNEKGLCIAGSGDHPLSLICHGIHNIQLFDINKLTEYFVLGIKRAMILKYDYYEYIEINKRLVSSNISLNEQTEILLGLLAFMEEPYKTFWKDIIDFNYKTQISLGGITKYINLFYLLCKGSFWKINIQNSIYLQNEEKYNYTRNNLGKVNFKFKYANVIDLTNLLCDKYDVILLSNTLDYVINKYEKNLQGAKLLEFSQELEHISNPGAVIFLYYIFNTKIADNLLNYFKNNLNETKNTFEIINIFSYYSSNKMILKKIKK